MTFISRRDLLKTAGLLGVAARAAGRDHAPALDLEGVATAQAAVRREPLEHLSADEMDVLEAVVARLIPTDEHGPGAREARAAHYIDRALGGALAASRTAYADGLAALDRFARTSRGRRFVDLAPADQDSVLVEVESGAATGFTGSSRVFFAMVLGHTHQGTFGDPYYGGNANFVGWDLLGYPGVRTMVSAADQQKLEAHELRANHRSAYDYDAFTKAGPK